MSNKTVFPGLLFFTFAMPALPQKALVDNLKAHITYLSSDSLEGRETSTRGELLAAQYIEKQFKSLALAPKGKNNSCFYEFTFKKSTNPHDTSTANAPVRKGINVAGFLDNGAEHTIVIGGHYDHLGKGEVGGSLEANSGGMIHNGADDNASGTAGVIELARHYTTNNVKENFNFLFICFSGEELGLFGSKKFCDSPTVDLSKVNCMINMDMIGRLNDSTKKVVIYGVGTSPEFVPILDRLPCGFSIIKDSSGVGPSDQTSFYLKDIPVLHYFTGQHKDYHKPSDDADKINYSGMEQILNHIMGVVNEISKLPKLKFAKTRSKDENTPKFKVTLGIMPDYTFEGKGVKVDGVTDGKPASKAGIEKNDVILQMGTIAISDMYSYMKALSEFKAGDTTTVILMRGSGEVKKKVAF